MTEFQANRYHTDLPVAFIINRCENAQRFGKKAAINGNVFLSLQCEQNVIAFERLTDSLRFWVRITDALHIGHHNKQKAIMLAHRFGERLNAAFRRRFFQPLANCRRVRQRASHRQRFICQRVARHAADLRKIDQMDHNEHRKQNGADHQNDGSAEFHGAFA